MLTVYENSTYLDKLLDTHFFSIRSRHYQALLYKIKEKAKEAGIAIHSKCHINNLDELKAAEMDNLNKVLKLECHLQKDCVNESNELNEGKYCYIFYSCLSSIISYCRTFDPHNNGRRYKCPIEYKSVYRTAVNA